MAALQVFARFVWRTSVLTFRVQCWGQDGTDVWKVVPQQEGQQVLFHYRHSIICLWSCFEAARARAVLLEGVRRQRKDGARRPLGARLLLLVSRCLHLSSL